MPTYVYRFVDSGETIEVQQSFTDSALTSAPHPTDGQLRAVKKVYTPVGVAFKGNGFYKTDSTKSTNNTKPSTTPAEAKTTEKTSEPVATPTEKPATTEKAPAKSE